MSEKPLDARHWRDVLPVHRAAELFPVISRDELLALGEDIKKNGLQQPVVLTEIMDEDPDGGFSGTGKYCVLDGRNRLDALEFLGPIFETIKKGKPRRGFEIKVNGERLGLPKQFVRYVLADDEFEFVVSANLHRRHLTPDQRRELIAKLLKAKPETSNNQIAKQVKADDKTVAKVRTELEATSEIPKLEKTVGKDGKERPAKRKPAVQETFNSPEEAHGKKFDPVEFMLSGVTNSADIDGGTDTMAKVSKVANAIMRLRDSVEMLTTTTVDASWDAFTELEGKKALAHINEAECALDRLRKKLKQHLASLKADARVN